MDFANFGSLIKTSGLSCLVFLLYFILVRVHRALTSPLRSLVSPPNAGFFLGNMRAIANVRKTLLWFSEYGNTYKIDGPFASEVLVTRDLKAIHHITTHVDTYEKGPAAQFILRRLSGEGLLLAEHHHHSRQRRILNPAFGVGQIRELTPIFNSEAQKLRERLSAINSDGPINITNLLGESAMQIIGLAGFNYDFGQQSEQLGPIFARLFQGAADSDFKFSALQGTFPILRLIPTTHATHVKLVRTEMNRIGKELVARIKKDIAGRSLGKKDFPTRDILSLLVRSNMAADLPDHQRLSDAEMIDQIPTFLLAGSETTSNAIAWTIYALCKYPAVQTRLRQELFMLSTDDPSMDELNSLQYLDHVLREVLRCWPPIGQIHRTAVRDDVIPLDTPVTNQAGDNHHVLRIQKGQHVFLHILGVNKSTEIWGQDALEFKPERWESPDPGTAQAVPGVWGNILSFNAGPHSCIGYRFAILEAKAYIFALVRAFVFELAVPFDKVGVSTNLVSRPVVEGDPEGQNKLPVLVKHFRGEE